MKTAALADQFAERLVEETGDLFVAFAVADRLHAVLDSMRMKREHDRLSAQLIERQQAEQLQRDRLTLRDPAVQAEVERFKRLVTQNLVLLRDSPSLSPEQRVAVEHILSERAEAALAKAGAAETPTADASA